MIVVDIAGKWINLKNLRKMRAKMSTVLLSLSMESSLIRANLLIFFKMAKMDRKAHQTYLLNKALQKSVIEHLATTCTHSIVHFAVFRASIEIEFGASKFYTRRICFEYQA